MHDPAVHLGLQLQLLDKQAEDLTSHPNQLFWYVAQNRNI